MLGYSPEELSPYSQSAWLAMCHAEDVAQINDPAVWSRIEAGEIVQYVSRCRHRHGQWVWMQTCCRAASWTPEGRLERVVGYDIDISAHRHMQAAAEEQRDLLRRILDTMPTGQLVCDPQGRVTFCNPVAAELIGRRTDEIHGRLLLDLLAIEEGREALDRALSSPEGHSDLTLVIRKPLDEGHEAAIRDQLAARPGPGESRRHIAVTVGPPRGSAKSFVSLADMTPQHLARVRLEQAVDQARYIATHDLMTGLPDRYFFLRRLSEALAEAGPARRSVAVMMLDLDSFKQFNDGMGHEMGDQLIKSAAARMGRGLPDRARLARFGGDEFVILVPDCPPAEAALLAHELQTRFETPVACDTQLVQVSCSIGIGIFPQDATSPEALLRAADLAMYEAKSMGRGQIRRFSLDLSARNDRRAAVLGAVQRALAEGGFRIVLQPKFDLAQLSTPIGAEVLLRLDDPELGAVSPAEFIPIAEQNGLISSVDREVLRMVEALVRGWEDEGLALPLSVNLSAVTLGGPGIADLVEDLPRLARQGGGLTVELTETSFVGRLGAVREALLLLRQGGVGVAIDDFGIGHSSLSYLHSLPIEELKIDRSFVAGLNARDEGPANAIVRAILAMAEALGLSTVAEGVETTEQADWLMKHGCLRAQGFLLGHPVDPMEFRRIYLSPLHEAEPARLAPRPVPAG